MSSKAGEVQFTILRCRHLLEEHNLNIQLLATINATLIAKGLMLKTDTVVDGTLNAAPSSIKSSSSERDTEMHQTIKGNQWHFGTKAHIGVDVDSGLTHSVSRNIANISNVTQGHCLLHGEEIVVFAEAGYQGAIRQADATGVEWDVAMRPQQTQRRTITNHIGGSAVHGQHIQRKC